MSAIAWIHGDAAAGAALAASSKKLLLLDFFSPQ